MNASDYKDFTTIMCAACDRGDPWEMAELLIKMGTYVNQTGKDDNSSMLWLCKNHRGFLRAGACVNLAEQALPLSWLRLTLGMNSVKTLLGAGAGVNITTNTGVTVVMNATYTGHRQCVKMLWMLELM